MDFLSADEVCDALAEHVRRYFGSRRVDVFAWTAGPIQAANPHFRVLRIAPREPNELWQYVSIGGWAATADQDHGLEFVLTSPYETPRAVELLAMIVYYHDGGRLALGHTAPIGEPWLPGSRCDHLMVSLPYPFGPALQRCHVGYRHVDFLWLLPITKAERDFKAANGQEELERRFDAAGLRYWEVERESVI